MLPDTSDLVSRPFYGSRTQSGLNSIINKGLLHPFHANSRDLSRFAQRDVLCCPDQDLNREFWYLRLKMLHG